MRWHSMRAVWRDRRGGVAIQLAFLMLFLMGMGALGTEVVYLLLMHRRMQSAADAAALNSATALSAGYPAVPSVEALATTAAAGFTNGTNSTTVTVNIPPLSGPRAGDAGSVEVIVSQPQTLGLISLFGPATYEVGARAVATAGTQSGYCLLALDPAAAGAVLVNNTGILSNPNCGVAVNSGSSSALMVENNAAVNGSVRVHGGWYLANNGQLNGAHNVSNADVVADPYAGVSAGTPPACTSQSGSVGNNKTVSLSPGHFCSGLNLSNGSTANLAAGTYYIDSQLVLASNATLNATSGSTLVINGNYGLSFGNNTHINIKAPTSGNLAGLALFGGRTATPSIIQNFYNNVTANIIGTIYFPNQTIEFAPGSQIGTTICTQIIGRIIRIYNNAYLDNHCTATGVQPIGASASQLVE